MDLDSLFSAYYSLYRTEADTPASSDDEYIVFKALSKEAINRWANYDNTFWKELYQTLQRSEDGENKLVSGQNEYTTPEDMRVAGGFLRIYDDNGTTQRRIKIIEPQDTQFQTDTTPYCYFVGNPNSGFTLNINGDIPAEQAGLNMDYVYYKKPVVLTAGNDTPDMSQPYFIIHRSLANRFRGSRNPYYQSAKNDAEDILRTMQIENNSGNWADPWKLADNSSGRFGA